MLQLIYCTLPPVAITCFSIHQRMETQLKNQEADPMVAFSDSVTYASMVIIR